MSYPSKTDFDNLRNSLPLTYQTRGNYAFRTDLASNINTALKNVNTALAFYAKKTDIPVVPSNVASKTDLAGYALASDLTKYQPAGKYVSPSDLEAYALASNLANYAKKTDIPVVPDLAGYALASDLTKYQPAGKYVSPSDLEAYALASNLANYTVKSDLDSYQTKGNYALTGAANKFVAANEFAAQQTFNGGINLGLNSSSNLLGKVNIPNATVGNLNVNNIKAASIDGYAKTSDLASYALKTELDSKTSDLASYAKSSDLVSYAKSSDLDSYAKSSDLAKDYAVKSDLDRYQTKGNYALTGAANEFAAQQTFNGGINLGLNSSSNLLGKVNIPNATVGNLNVTGNIDGYAKTSDLASYAKSSDLASYQTKGNYALTGAANTFNAQQIFMENATVRTMPNKPFQVTGEGGLDVKGNSTVGNLNVTGTLKAASIDGYAKTSDLASYAKSSDLASYQNKGNYALTGAANTFNAQQTFDQNATVRTMANKPFQVTGEGGLDVKGNATVTGILKASSAGIRPIENADWMRIYGTEGMGTAMYNSVSIRDGGGLNVGEWERVEQGMIKTKNLNVTGNATVGGALNVTGNINVTNDMVLAGSNSWIMHTPNDGRRTLYVAPTKTDNSDWNWGASTEFYNDGGVLIKNGLNVNSGDTAGIQTPNGNLKINKNGIMLGGNNNGKETNSAQISAGIWVPNSLNIVGMSSGPGAADRKIDAFAEGGFTIHGGQLNVRSIKIGRWTITGGNDLEIKADNGRPAYKFAINNDGNFVAKTGNYERNF